MFVFMGFFVLTFFGMVSGWEGGDMPVGFNLIVPMHFLTMLVGILLMVIYIIMALRNEHLVGNAKLLWVLILFMGNMFAMPMYWYLYIWNDPLTGPASGVFKNSVLGPPRD